MTQSEPESVFTFLVRFECQLSTGGTSREMPDACTDATLQASTVGHLVPGRAVRHCLGIGLSA